MTKRLILVLALAFVVGLAVSAYAEVQNVKVSGDLLLRAISRSQFNLGSYDNKYSASGLTSQMRLRVDADLTDNVSTTIRLINERSWGGGLSLYQPGELFGIGEIDGISLYDGQEVQGAASVWDHPIEIDLAYVTLKEFLYSPLTLTLGRQELRFGNALIIGDSDTNMIANAFGIPFDLSLKKSFDAIRATLDYSPWVLDAVYSKINENDLWWLQNMMYDTEHNDADLMGMNAAWDMKALGITGKTDLYYWRKTSKLDWAESEASYNKDAVNTVGALISGQLVDRLTGSLEIAWQFGRAPYDITGVNTASNLKRRAMAIQAMLNYAFDKKGSPTLGFCYTYLSGDNKTNNKLTFWDPMFEDQTPNNIVNALLPNSGVQAINLLGSIKPKDDLSLAMNLGFYMLPSKPKESHGTTYGIDVPSPYYFDEVGLSNKRNLGVALDLTATYDYTEDVQLGLTWGMLKPGKAFDREDGFKKTATQLIGSMKVTF